jgi:UrcA family protein
LRQVKPNRSVVQYDGKENEDLMIHMRLSFHAAIFLGVLFVPITASAQPHSESPTDVSGPNEEITVLAPRAVRQQTLQPAIGKKLGIQLLTVRRMVSYADLNLSKATDAKELETRITAAAVMACTDLERAYPSSAYVPTPPNQDCVAMAVKAPLSMVRLISSSFHE